MQNKQFINSYSCFRIPQIPIRTFSGVHQIEKLALSSLRHISHSAGSYDQINSAKDDSNSYLQQLLQQREEEYRQEVAKLTAEIKSLKLNLWQLKSK